MPLTQKLILSQKKIKFSTIDSSNCQQRLWLQPATNEPFRHFSHRISMIFSFFQFQCSGKSILFSQSFPLFSPNWTFSGKQTFQDFYVFLTNLVIFKKVDLFQEFFNILLDLALIGFCPKLPTDPQTKCVTKSLPTQF